MILSTGQTLYQKGGNAVEAFVNIAICMEMLIINLIVVDVCAHRRYSLPVTLLGLTGFTLALNACTVGLWEWLDFQNGNGLFALFGIAFLLPLRLLYRESSGRIMDILFSGWDYTMTVYCVSVQLARLTGAENFLLRLLEIQTLLYLLTAAAFVLWIRRGFLYVLQHTSLKINRFLRIVSLGWFVTVQVCNLALIYRDISWLPAAAFFTLALNASLSFWFLYSQVKSAEDVVYLERIVYRDALTGLYNRARLFLDAEELMASRRAFVLIYMDLNRFKAVNDRYGHLEGDKYLCAFAGAAERLLKEEGVLYRMSGDEFVCLYQGGRSVEFIRSLTALTGTALPGCAVPFGGCGIGCAVFPGEAPDLDNLIHLADARMYANKQGLPEAGQ